MVIEPSGIKGGHELTSDYSVVSNQMQNIVRSVNYHCGDNDILEKSSMRYFQELTNWVNKKEDEHEYQKQ